MSKVLLGLLSVVMMLSVSACLQTGGAAKGEAVKSEALNKVDYDAESDKLTLVFERGTYEFAKVPQKVYDGLMKSDSKGAYFQSKIKGKYKATKVE